ncbi:uncharacterized protein [Narcine bancroftii]|uniref:uncharacterized protein isoform X2 n=1 Tax=Narcine bancroftii TaxID=1343680 RepID=UPI003831A268
MKPTERPPCHHEALEFGDKAGDERKMLETEMGAAKGNEKSVRRIRGGIPSTGARPSPLGFSLIQSSATSYVIEWLIAHPFSPPDHDPLIPADDPTSFHDIYHCTAEWVPSTVSSQSSLGLDRGSEGWRGESPSPAQDQNLSGPGPCNGLNSYAQTIHYCSCGKGRRVPEEMGGMEEGAEEPGQMEKGKEAPVSSGGEWGGGEGGRLGDTVDLGGSRRAWRRPGITITVGDRGARPSREAKACLERGKDTWPRASDPSNTVQLVGEAERTLPTIAKVIPAKAPAHGNECEKIEQQTEELWAVKESCSPCEAGEGTDMTGASKLLERMSTEEVCEWLTDSGFQSCVPHIRESGITGRQLANTDPQLFDKLQLRDTEDRERLLFALYQELNPANMNVDEILGSTDIDTVLSGVALPMGRPCLEPWISEVLSAGEDLPQSNSSYIFHEDSALMKNSPAHNLYTYQPTELAQNLYSKSAPPSVTTPEKEQMSLLSQRVAELSSLVEDELKKAECKIQDSDFWKPVDPVLIQERLDYIQGMMEVAEFNISQTELQKQSGHWENRDLDKASAEGTVLEMHLIQQKLAQTRLKHQFSWTKAQLQGNDLQGVWQQGRSPLSPLVSSAAQLLRVEANLDPAELFVTLNIDATGTPVVMSSMIPDLAEGDLLIEINGISARGSSLEALEQMFGEASTVQLLVLRTAERQNTMSTESALELTKLRLEFLASSSELSALRNEKKEMDVEIKKLREREALLLQENKRVLQSTDSLKQLLERSEYHWMFLKEQLESMRGAFHLETRKLDSVEARLKTGRLEQMSGQKHISRLPEQLQMSGSEVQPLWRSESQSPGDRPTSEPLASQPHWLDHQACGDQQLPCPAPEHLKDQTCSGEGGQEPRIRSPPHLRSLKQPCPPGDEVRGQREIPLARDLHDPGGEGQLQVPRQTPREEMEPQQPLSCRHKCPERCRRAQAGILGERRKALPLPVDLCGRGGQPSRAGALRIQGCCRSRRHQARRRCPPGDHLFQLSMKLGEQQPSQLQGTENLTVPTHNRVHQRKRAPHRHPATERGIQHKNRPFSRTNQLKLCRSLLISLHPLHIYLPIQTLPGIWFRSGPTQHKAPQGAEVRGHPVLSGNIEGEHGKEKAADTFVTDGGKSHVTSPRGQCAGKLKIKENSHWSESKWNISSHPEIQMFWEKLSRTPPCELQS